MKSLLLAAGLGTRLRPFTDVWPKCLMPIGQKPLLEIWLESMQKVGIDQVLVNLHYHAEAVQAFLQRTFFSSWVNSVYEEQLLGTAGTLRENAAFLRSSTILCSCRQPVSL